VIRHLTPLGIALGLILLGLGLFQSVPRSAAHGSLAYPVSRVYACYLEGPERPQSLACQEAVAQGGTQPLYDWNEVNLPDVAGEHQARIPDGQLCSAGREKYAAFDQPRTDWTRTSLPPAASHTFQYAASAPHNHGHFEVYVTRTGYDPADPLTWADLEQIAMHHEPPLVNGYYVLDEIALPPDRQGHHLIYTIWQRHDSPEAFYTCSDVWLGSQPPPTPTPTPPGQTACAVDYHVVNAWENGFQAEVRIVNQGSQPIHGWSLAWEFPGGQQITSLWNASHTQDGSAVTATDAGWNGHIPAAGGQVSLGFVASGSSQPRPVDFLLNGQNCAAEGASTAPPHTGTAIFLPYVEGR
jgi:chitin-binding protein